MGRDRGDVKTQLEGLLDASIAGHFASERITSLKYGAFAGCGNLTSVDLPNVTSIAYATFDQCSALAEVNLPEMRFGNTYCFSTCTSLARIKLPKLSSTYFGMFHNCSALAALVLPGSFVTAQAETSNCFNNTPILSGTGYVYVPKALVDKYKAATNWVTIADQIRAIEDYPEICDPE